MEIRENMGRISGNKQKSRENGKFPYKKPAAGGNFEDFRGVFGQKTHPKCTQEGVFDTKNASKMPQNFPPAAGILL